MWFWILYVISLLFTGWVNWPADRNGARPFGSWVILYILIGLLGWGIFGSPLK